MKKQKRIKSIAGRSVYRYTKVKATQFVFNPDNPRAPEDRDNKIAELEADIRKRGQLQPVLAVELPNGKLLLLEGERRIKAMRNINRHMLVDVGFCDAPTKMNQFDIMLAANCKRENVDLGQHSIFVAKYRDEFKKEHPELTDPKEFKRVLINRLCDLTHRSPNYIASCDAINEIPDEELRTAVRTRKLAPNLAIEIKRATRHEATREGLWQAATESLHTKRHMGALAPRNIKDEIRVIERKISAGEISPPQAKKATAHLAKHKYGLGATPQHVGDASAYLAVVEVWRSTVFNWSPRGLTKEQALAISGALLGLHGIWHSKATAFFGPLRAPRKYTPTVDEVVNEK